MDLCFTAVPALFSWLLAVEALKKWRTTDRALYASSAVAFLLAALAFPYTCLGIFLFLWAAVLRIMAGFRSRLQAQELEHAQGPNSAAASGNAR
ncbi:MAG: hypothetical protein PVJ32_06110 [Anaerolineales bacterium]|jgi:TRAP-type C4-dicarboxylate transport system permease small subunit